MAVKTATAVKKVRELSEEDVLKAPDKDYMNEAQLAFFKRKLIELRDQLLQNADDTGEHLRENEVTTDPSDRATLEEEYTLELRTRDRERKLLKKVEKSIRMIDDASPPYMLHSAPRVLNRRQYNEYRIVGRFADAATAKASATKNAMFWPLARIPRMMPRMPRTTTVMRETRTCSSPLQYPRLMTLA